MPTWLSEGDVPSEVDTEVRSLWKINSLCVQWAALRGVTPIPRGLRSVNPSTHDTEANSLQKINSCLAAIAGL